MISCRSGFSTSIRWSTHRGSSSVQLWACAAGTPTGTGSRRATAMSATRSFIRTPFGAPIVADDNPPCYAGTASGLGDHAGQFEDLRRGQVLFGDADTQVGQGVLDGVGDGGGGADHPALADAPVVEGNVRRRLHVVDL